MHMTVLLSADIANEEEVAVATAHMDVHII